MDWHPAAPLNQLQPRRVCLVKPSALGDVVQTLPVLSGLRARWPTAEFSWVINRGLAGLLAGHPDLAEVIPFDRSARGWRRLPSTWTLARRLRAAKPDLVIDLQGLARSGLMTRWTGARRRVGFASAREGARWAYTDPIETAPGEQPAVDRYWTVARALGCQGPPPAAVLGLRPHHAHWARQALAGLPYPRISIHPGAQWATKRWPPEHYAELACRAITDFGAGIVLVGGPGEQGLAEAVAQRCPRGIKNLAGKTGLLELAGLLAQVDVAVSGDTGPMHLAAAMGTPVVALFTCTSPRRAGPHGAGHRVVATRLPCAASYLRECSHLSCMRELSPGRVWPALEAALEEWRSRRVAG